MSFSCLAEKTGTPHKKVQLSPSSTPQSDLATSSSSQVFDAPTRMEGLVDEFLNMCAKGKASLFEVFSKYQDKINFNVLCLQIRTNARQHPGL